MAAPDWSRLEAAFAAAVAAPADEREGVLAEAAGDDPALLAELCSLLAAHDRGDGILDRPSPAAALSARPPEPPAALAGRRLGAYRLLHEIGSGGMSRVFLAARDDGEYEQRVAVKVLRHGLEGADSVARFRRERQILARLEHPAIARLPARLGRRLAGELYQEALDLDRTAGRTGTLGHAYRLNDLGNLRHSEGDLEGAERLYRRSLEMMQAAHGTDHPRVATVLDNLGTLVAVQGRFGEAEALLRRALDSRRRRLGPDHPQVATGLHNLGLMLIDRGEHAAAEHPLLDRLRGRGGEMTALLARLASIETPSTEPQSLAPALALLADELACRGYPSRRLAGERSGGMLYARPRRLPRGWPRQLLLGHLDTVWPLGTLAEMPVREEGGRLYGPGVYDMKGGIVQMLFALGELEEPPPVAPVVLLTTDEEVGSGESVSLIRRLAAGADRVLVLEPSLGPAGDLKIARKGVGRFTVRVHGRAAHAGLDPGAGASAILELSHVVQRLFALNDPERGTTVNVGTIDGGIRPNVVAAESRAVVDVRVRDAGEADRITAAIHGLRATTPGTRLEIAGAIRRPPMVPAASAAVMRLAREAAAELGLTLDGAEAGGGSDGNFAAAHAPTLDGLGAVGDGAHAAHEHVEIDRMPERAALLARLLAAPPLASRRPAGGSPG